MWDKITGTRKTPTGIALLQCVKDISNKSKIEVLLPILLALSQDLRQLYQQPDVGTKDADIYLCCKNLLVALLHEIPLIVRVLVASGPETSTSPKANKHPKLSEVPDDAFPRLSPLAEVLARVSLPGSLDPVSRLLETLHNVVQSTTSTDVNISYIDKPTLFSKCSVYDTPLCCNLAYSS
ncbi:hypothetical protein B0H14DRAFT_2627707 [Mycena olivaceomarginata]|nr:hypothetical protein B0H14DRAFT_2627707 [Mycena olivaceomarginata]